jgi:hypothetical protein
MNDSDTDSSSCFAAMWYYTMDEQQRAWKLLYREFKAAQPEMKDSDDEEEKKEVPAHVLSCSSASCVRGSAP